ncbi:DsbA family oxidoreductase [Cellulomonas triticagri]|uniref:DsbA family oxidoreductase n=1 Tax=Cellulomonas triticagri TaxID=2483352 RepID=A0A3M2JBT1_9CELL|nr:DsbA family oxidoreductase [Cellulomonas triticagri]RMI08973.1 DsbA family oxidoreductase [Cellulomonas triticagri]
MRDLQIEIWSDIACPWCYIGKRRFAAALAGFEHRDHVRVTWRSFELQPDAEPSSAHPGLTEAQMLSERKGLPLDQVQQMFAQVTSVAASVGLAYDFDRVVPANTFDAHRLVHVAADLGGADAAADVVERLMSAHFEHGAVVDDVDVLVGIAVEAGLDGDAVRAALASDAGAGAVRADEAEAAALGISGVPFFVADRKIGVSGAQPVEVFAQLLDQAWTTANPPLAIPTIAGAADAEACGPDGC